VEQDESNGHIAPNFFSGLPLFAILQVWSSSITALFS